MIKQLGAFFLWSSLASSTLADTPGKKADQGASKIHKPAEESGLSAQALSEAAPTEAFLARLQPPFDELHAKSMTHTAEVLHELEKMDDINKQPALYQAQYYYLLAEIYDTTVLPQKAHEALKTGLSLVDEKSQPYLFHSLQITLVRTLDLLGKQRRALHMINASIAWANSFTSYKMRIEALTARGLLYNSMDEPLKALEDFQSAYKIAVEHFDKKFIGISASYIALVYDELKEGDLAVTYYQEAVDLHRQHGFLTDLSISLYGLGRAYRNTGNYRLAKQHLAESVAVARQIGDQQGIAYGLKELATLIFNDGDYQAAQNMLLETLDIFKEANNNYALLSAYQALAEISLAAQAYDSAMDYLKRAKSLLLKESMTNEIIQLKTIEARILMGQGQYQASSVLFQEVVEESSALARKRAEETIFKLQAEFDLDKKENENTILETQNRLQKLSIESERRRNSFFFLVTLSAAGICLLLILLMSRSLKHQRQLEILAGHDSLTGLLNRRRILEMLSLHLSLAQRHEQSLCVAMFDLDYFKKINDQLGHGAGDTVLKAFGQLCRDNIRKTDQLGRIGGEEFILVLPQTSIESAHVLLERIRKKTESISCILPQPGRQISVSIGVKAYDGIESSDDILARIDQALYQAKESGRNQIVVYEA